MKIAVIGNMNNMYFSLTRYLIDHGYDCKQLIFNNEPQHFHPSWDTYQDHYKAYCKQLTWGAPADFLKQDFKQVKLDLKGFDFLIGNGSAPAFVNRIGRKLDIFIPYGEDLYSFPFFKLVHPFRIPAYLQTAYYQRKGIQDAPYIMFDKSNSKIEGLFKKLKFPGKRIISPLPLLYHKDYDEANLNVSKKANPFYRQIKEIRERNDLVVLQHIRQVWKPTRDKWSIKGNDKLLRGFAEFIRLHPQIKSKLILFEYGVHVDDTIKLMKKLQIENHVVWFPKMPRKYIMHFINWSDVVVGELFHSWLTYCAVLECLCLGKPIMHKRIDKQFNTEYSELYPMLFADSPESVLEGLKKVLNDKEEIQQIGLKGQEWFFKYCIHKPLTEIVSIIKEKRFSLVCQSS